MICLLLFKKSVEQEWDVLDAFKRMGSPFQRGAALRGAWRRRERRRSWRSRRRRKIVIKKTGLQSQERNDYTSSCLLWHFSKLIIHCAFLPLLPRGQLSRLGKKGDKRCTLPSPPLAMTPSSALFWLCPSPPHFHLVVLLILLSSSFKPWTERLRSPTPFFAYRRHRFWWPADRLTPTAVLSPTGGQTGCGWLQLKR